jgi:hypothetical protein
VTKKLQNSYDCDLDMDDTVGEDEPNDKRIINIVPALSTAKSHYSRPGSQNCTISFAEASSPGFLEDCEPQSSSPQKRQLKAASNFHPTLSP